MSMTEATYDTSDLPDYASIPTASKGVSLNEQGYYVGRVERNLYWITDGVYQCAFLTTSDGVLLLDAPPTIGNNIQRAIDEIAAANGVSNKVEYLIYSHHHADHVGAALLFDKNVTRIGHEETRHLLLRHVHLLAQPIQWLAIRAFRHQHEGSSVSHGVHFRFVSDRRFPTCGSSPISGFA
jgi:glyoxylase-like metal-dependent hydrolase (beta-lactamase superfamily II)